MVAPRASWSTGLWKPAMISEDREHGRNPLLCRTPSTSRKATIPLLTKVTWNVEGGTAVSKSTKAAGSTYASNVPGTYHYRHSCREQQLQPGPTHSAEPSTFPAPNPISGSWKEAHWKGGSACQVAASGGTYDFTRYGSTPIVVSGRIATRAARCTSLMPGRERNVGNHGQAARLGR